MVGKMSKLDELINGLCPDGGEYKTLGDIGDVRMCKRILKERTSDNGDIPFYKIGTVGKESDAYISQKLFEEYKEKYSYPRAGEVLISASGTIGRTVIFDGQDAYNTLEPDERETDKLNQLKYVFIDDPVTSLDDNHLIQMAVDPARLIKNSKVENGLNLTTLLF